MKLVFEIYVFILSVVGGMVLFVPTLVFAQGGLVPCTGLDCNFEHFIKLLNGIINWAVGIAPFLAGIAFAVAGFMYFSSRGNPEQVKQAHQIFQNTFIGIALVIGAWLIVKTILAGLGADNILSGLFSQ